ncbi:SRPBCC family protein [Micromonospora tarensis]|uniref:SRPBCC family protein n=1 Tax=Micromonospora tarensis TaxID=2806100 RepID=A0ABS1YH48_9ACTN|nr:SRPBCC family protein [Micromonospora tarensis]
MILVERSAHVAAPIEVVWDVVQRAEQLPAWLAGVRAPKCSRERASGGDNWSRRGAARRMRPRSSPTRSRR